MKEFIKKLLPLSLSAGLAIFLILAFAYPAQQTPEEKNLAKTFFSPEISISSRQIAYSQPDIAPYKTMDIFISEEHDPGFKFTSVGMSWDEYALPKTAVEMEIQFKTGNTWSEWISLDEEIESESPEKTSKYSFASSALSDAFRYKVIMYGDGVEAPIIKNAEWTAIKAQKTISVQEVPKPNYASSVIGNTLTHLKLNISNRNIIGRSAWGANETYRYFNGEPNAEPELATLSADFYEEFKEELKLSKVVKEDSAGNKYSWPLQYPTKVRKIIIHHTATTKNLDDPKQAIRDIYYYHSVTKSWGDVGYNYIIDKNGNIYEGRFGGEGVIGAHAGPGNNGSIGISLLGDFENNPVPDKMVNSLIELIAEKSKLHGINPTGTSLFRGKLLPNVIGHKDLMNTACPGANLYSKLPVIRNLALKKTALVNEKKKFVIDYDYIDRSDVQFLEMNTGETEEITIKFENIGKLDWNKETFIVVNQNPAFEGMLNFPDKQGAVLAKINENIVKPGEIASFTFKIKAGSKTDLVYMNIAPLVNGTKKIEDYKILPVNVSGTDFQYEFISMDKLPLAMDGNIETNISVKLRNTGNSTWRKSGQNTVYLGTDHPRDNISMLSNPRSARIGYLQENEVKKGEIGTFIINIKTPGISGYYRQYFTPVVENVSWMQDSGIYIETTVFGEGYSSELVSITPSSQWQRGKSYLIWVTIRNIGKETWNKKDFTLHVLGKPSLLIKEAKFMSDEVKPGEVVKIVFVVSVDAKEDLEQKTIQIRPKIKGNNLILRPIYFRYNIIENSQVVAKQQNEQALKDAKTANETPQKIQAPTSGTSNSNNSASLTNTGNLGNDIRVKLSFKGNPEITSDGNFDIYSGSVKFASLAGGEKAKISFTNGKYKVETPAQVFYKVDSIRLTPTGNGIIRLNNYENRPSWNTALNDNEYRGLLEVRNVDSALTVINELPLEYYLRGLGEVGNSEPFEKIKAIMVSARSYAKYYTDIDVKFTGKPYHLDDDPDVSQKYIGYGFEKRASTVASAIQATEGEVVIYNDKLIKTPYFNQSDGTSTKSAKDVWNWDSTPYLISVNDSYCKGDKFLGHGVGLSGCGAKGMAEAGFNYKDILKHYYTGIEIKKVY